MARRPLIVKGSCCYCKNLLFHVKATCLEAIPSTQRTIRLMVVCGTHCCYRLEPCNLITAARTPLLLRRRDGERPTCMNKNTCILTVSCCRGASVDCVTSNNKPLPEWSQIITVSLTPLYTARSCIFYDVEPFSVPFFPKLHTFDMIRLFT